MQKAATLFILFVLPLFVLADQVSAALLGLQIIGFITLIGITGIGSAFYYIWKGKKWALYASVFIALPGFILSIVSSLSNINTPDPVSDIIQLPPLVIIALITYQKTKDSKPHFGYYYILYTSSILITSAIGSTFYTMYFFYYIHYLVYSYCCYAYVKTILLNGTILKPINLYLKAFFLGFLSYVTIQVFSVVTTVSFEFYNMVISSGIEQYITGIFILLIISMLTTFITIKTTTVQAL